MTHNDYLLRLRYGITSDERTQLIAKQNGVCPVCGADITGKLQSGKGAAHIDHCHKTKKIRGVLCHRCNRAIGLFGDDVEIVEKAAAYLRRSIKEEES